MTRAELLADIVAVVRGKGASALRLEEMRQRLRDRRLARRLAGPKLVEAFGQAYPRAFFIEIGANDGLQHDPLRSSILSREWSGIMVEPVPFVFERLRRNYGELGRVALENMAIADRDGHVPFFHLREADDDERPCLPGWYDGIGSFSYDSLLRHARHIPDIERRVVRTEVPCLTLESLYRKHAVDSVDLLLVDVEGYDHEVIKQIDFTARRPRLLVYEHYHLSAEQRSDCLNRLRGQGYETMEEGFDTWCLDPRSDRLTATWQGLRPGVEGLSMHDEAA